jgi:hypothetical protein
MDVAPDGQLALAFYDVEFGGLGFALGSRHGEFIWWDYEEVDGYPDSDGLNPGDRGQYCSMMVAPDGTIWISYYNSTTGGLYVAHRTGKKWELELADAGTGLSPDAGQWTSLALDADNRPVVAHYMAGSGELRVARRLDGSWVAETVWTGEAFEGAPDTGDGAIEPRPASVGKFARLHIDGSTEYIAFYDAAQQTLNLLEGFPGSYVHTVVDDSSDSGQWPSILVDEDTVAIAYHDVGNQNLMLAKRAGGGPFVTEVVDDAKYVGADTEVFDHEGDIGIIYFDGKNNNMNMAIDGEAGWELSVLGGDDGALGFFNEVVRDRNGQYWAASYNYTDRNIFVRSLQ